MASLRAKMRVHHAKTAGCDARRAYLSQGVIGTMASLAITGVLAAIAVHAAHFTGLAGEEASYVKATDSQVDLRGLLLAGIIIGSLGVLNRRHKDRSWTMRWRAGRDQQGGGSPKLSFQMPVPFLAAFHEPRSDRAAGLRVRVAVPCVAGVPADQLVMRRVLPFHCPWPVSVPG